MTVGLALTSAGNARATTGGAIETESTHDAAERFAGSPPAPPGPEQKKTWYGWQILTADVAGAGCVLGTENGVCALPYFFGGPVIHLAHGQRGRAAASFGMRVMLPAVGAVIGSATANCPEAPPRMPPAPPSSGGDAIVLQGDFGGDFFPCGFGRAVVGMLAGMVLAVGVDSALAFEATPMPERATTSASPLRRIEPQLSLSPTDVSFGLRGSF